MDDAFDIRREHREQERHKMIEVSIQVFLKKYTKVPRDTMHK